VEPIRAEIEAVYTVLVGNFNPAIFQPAWLSQFYFSRSVFLAIPPTAPARFSVGADDYAEVFVNGTSMLAIGSLTSVPLASATANSFHTVDIAPLLVPGWNTITVMAQNGRPPASPAAPPAPSPAASTPRTPPL
jgi:hypothetical protein